MRIRRSWLAALAGALLLASTDAGAQGAGASPRTVQVAQQTDFVLILRSDGSVVGFGSDTSLLAARPSSSKGRIEVPTVLDLPPRVTQVAISSDAAYALLDDGTLLAWGTNDRGQFGGGAGSSRTPGNPMRSATPIRVASPKPVAQIVAAGHHALALATDGTVLTWGDDPSGGPAEMRVVEGLEQVTQVAAAGTHDLALTKAGVVLAWGENGNGQLGVPLDTRRSTRPVQVPGLDHVVSIGAYGNSNFGYSGAVKADGTVWMWGSNQAATMGNGLKWGTVRADGSVNYPAPEQVKGLAAAKSLSIGNGHVVVLMADRSLRIWGHDGWGQTGMGTWGGYQEAPKKPAITDVVYAVGAGTATYAVRADGSLWRWGASTFNNRATELGNDRHVPAPLQLP